MRKPILIALLLLGIAACKKDDNNNGGGNPTNPGADWMTQSLTATNMNLKVDNLPAADTNASSTNYPQVLMDRPMTAPFAVPAGFAINLYEEKIPDARNICIAPNGDVFVAQSGENRIMVLRDLDNDGHSDTAFVWGEGGVLARPHGMAFYQNKFYVANTGAVIRYDYASGQTSGGSPVVLAMYPGGGQHPARSLALDTVNNKMYIGIGSTLNVGIEDDPKYAAILQHNLDGTGQTIYCSGIRVPQGLAVNYAGGAKLWSCVNERDGLGDELVPDYVTSIEPGAFYGWPFVYLRPDKADPRIKMADPRAATTRTPDVLVQAHSAALGICFYTGTQFPEEYRGDAYVACRGSWNRSNGTGYKIIRVKVSASGAAEGGYEDFVRGWRVNEGQGGVPQVFGRPLNIVVAKDGSMLIADDAGGAVWRLRYKG